MSSRWSAGGIIRPHPAEDLLFRSGLATAGRNRIPALGRGPSSGDGGGDAAFPSLSLRRGGSDQAYTSEHDESTTRYCDTSWAPIRCHRQTVRRPKHTTSNIIILCSTDHPQQRAQKPLFLLSPCGVAPFGGPYHPIRVHAGIFTWGPVLAGRALSSTNRLAPMALAFGVSCQCTLSQTSGVTTTGDGWRQIPRR